MKNITLLSFCFLSLFNGAGQATENFPIKYIENFMEDSDQEDTDTSGFLTPIMSDFSTQTVTDSSPLPPSLTTYDSNINEMIANHSQNSNNISTDREFYKQLYKKIKKQLMEEPMNNLNEPKNKLS